MGSISRGAFGVLIVLFWVSLSGVASADESMVLTASGVDIRRMSRVGTLRWMGSGAGLSIGVFERDGSQGRRLMPAVEASTFFVGRAEEEWAYGLSISAMLTLRLTEQVANPFVGVSAGASYVRVDDLDGRTAEGLVPALGGQAGVHGFIDEEFYYRLSIGYWAAGVGGLKTQVGVGYVFDS
jgi:hypothetical protein